jgi:hypothetical protein
MKKPKLKLLIFYAITLAPILSLLAVVFYFGLLTNVPQLIHQFSLRNIYFDCMEFSPAEYVYKMKPGECRFRNLEFNTTLTHDKDGFRNVNESSRPQIVSLGDSHTQGWGVGDNETFSRLLESQTGYRVRNLGVASYATMRELEVLESYGNRAAYVILQYCDNDANENEMSLKLSREDFRAQVNKQWRERIATYKSGKALGFRKPIQDLVALIRGGSYTWKSAWRKEVQERQLSREADVFAQILVRYRQLLEGKRLIVFESADFGRNSPRFAQAFGAALKELEWLETKVLDSTRILDFSDYYFLDGHIKPAGHRKLGAAFAAAIKEFETREIQ